MSADGKKIPFSLKTFGRNVRKLRRAAGFTQEDFAHASGIDRSYFGGVERGDRNPALEMILRIADGLGVHPAALFEEAPHDGERR